MPKYLIQLKPLAPYFFGGENTFGEGQNQNYFAKSLLFPQQSTVLGVLRYTLLKKHNLLNFAQDKKDEVKTLIGSKSFSLSYAVNGDATTFGKISKISPVVLVNVESGKLYTAMPLDYKPITDVTLEDANVLWSTKHSNKLPIITGFNVKKYDNFCQYINVAGEIITSSELFNCADQIGIRKSNRQDNDENAFFKQTLVSLHKDFAFAFVAEIDDDLDGYTDMVYMGANRSMFQITIKPTDIDLTSPDKRNYFYDLSKEGRYLLLSDAYISDKVKAASDFIWGESNSIRTIESSVDNGISWKKPKKTALYHLLNKGSVIYTEVTLDQQLSIANMQAVGYNIFIKPKEK